MKLGLVVQEKMLFEEKVYGQTDGWTDGRGTKTDHNSPDLKCAIFQII